MALNPEKENKITTLEGAKNILDSSIKPNNVNSQSTNCSTKTKIQKTTKTVLSKAELSKVKKQIKVEKVNDDLEGLERLQEEMKLGFNNLIKKIIDKIIEMFATFFKKFLPKYIAKYMDNKKSQKEREELMKQIQKKKIEMKPKLK